MIYTVLYAVDPESVQVIIRPSHGYLQDVMKVGNGARAGYQEPSPDDWADANQ
jgi:hypothetical protein